MPSEGWETDGAFWDRAEAWLKANAAPPGASFWTRAHALHRNAMLDRLRRDGAETPAEETWLADMKRALRAQDEADKAAKLARLEADSIGREPPERQQYLEWQALKPPGYWDRVRAEMLDLCDHRCERCGRKGEKWPVHRQLVVHHTDYAKRDDPEYLRVLCWVCHRIAHGFVAFKHQQHDEARAGYLALLAQLRAKEAEAAASAAAIDRRNERAAAFRADREKLGYQKPWRLARRLRR